mgnify:CR=1 FL=1|tara:strand:+ start:322 stop:483 length:162 start_codon:yes stop_codon:yes gene_type:complete
MGFETVLTCDRDFGEIVGKFSGDKKFQVGQNIKFLLNEKKLHFFVSASKRRLF